MKKLVVLFLLLSSFFLIITCKKEEVGSLKSDKKEILKFEISGSIDEAEIDNENHTIVITMIEGETEISRLSPDKIVVSDNATVRPESSVNQDFTKTVEYIVEAEDGSTQPYSVTVYLVPSSAKIITSFTFRKNDNVSLEKDITSRDINESAGTIEITVPFLAGRKNLLPFIRYQGASISPGQKEIQDFTEEISYIVTAIDGSKKEYTVVVGFDSEDIKEISSFIFEAENNLVLDGEDVVGKIEGSTISATVSYKAIGELAPTISYTGVGIDPVSGVKQNFTNNVYYTVTAENESTYRYTVILGVDKNTDAGIKRVKLDGVEEEELAIDHVNGTVTGTILYGADLRNVVPEVIEIFDGASIHPSVDKAQNFTRPVKYVVTAQDGKTQQEYWVTIAQSKRILEFNFLATDNPLLAGEDVVGEIDHDEKMITLAVPYGTDRSNLVPYIIYNGIKIDPDNQRIFTNPVIYTVTAEDQTTQQYTVTVVTQPALEAVSYYNGVNRVGAGDFKKPDLFEVSIVPDGNWNYGLSIEGNTEIRGTVMVTGGKGIINNTMGLESWQSIDSDKNLSIELKISKAGVSEQITIHTNIPKEQYKIKSWQDLQGMQYNLNGHYTLENNISLPDPSQTGGYFPEELPAEGFYPVGDSYYSSFTGSFDGQGHLISNFFIYRPSESYIGLFGRIEDATIKNVGVEISSREVTGYFGVGGLVGVVSGGSIINSYTTGSVTGEYHVGGLVGAMWNGAITNSYATGSVTGNHIIGGLVGYLYGYDATNSYATGSVMGSRSVNGLVGYSVKGGNSIIDSYWDKDSTGQDEYVGTGVSSGANLKQVPGGGGYIDEGNNDNPVFVNWQFGSSDDSPWKWLGNGEWPILYWQQDN